MKDSKSAITKKDITRIIIFVTLILAAFIAIQFFKEKNSGTSEEKLYFSKNSQYNASRYFFRIGRPDDWDVNSKVGGFLLNEETGLVIELFPVNLITLADTSTETLAPNATQKPANVVREPIEGALMSIYYFSMPIATTENPTATDYTLSEATTLALNSFKTHINTSVYSFGEATPYNLAERDYFKIEYTYTKVVIDEITQQTSMQNWRGVLYVCVRGMAYYMVTYEGEDSVFSTYESDFYEILSDFRFSVFDY